MISIKFIKTNQRASFACKLTSSGVLIRPFGKVLSATRKMIPTPTTSSSSLSSFKGSLYEFQKLPYNPATPIRPQSPLESLWTTLKRSFYFVQFLFKSIPIWISLIVDWLFPSPPKIIAGWNALVTGGSNGIGRAICVELAKQGSNVIVADMDAENGDKLIQELLKHGVKAIFYQVDVSDFKAIVELGHRVKHDFGPVDILVNNAAAVPFLVQDEYSPENLQRMMNVNILSNFWTIKTFLPGMYERRRGHVVSLSSRAAYIPTGFYRNYTTTKYAVRGFMEDLHDEIYRAGYEGLVNTTTVFPSLINTRKELMDAFFTLPGVPQMVIPPPELAGTQIVEAIRSNKRKLFIANGLQTWQLALFEDLPRDITRLLYRELFKG